jgi:hypothetical protein
MGESGQNHDSTAIFFFMVGGSCRCVTLGVVHILTTSVQIWWAAKLAEAAEIIFNCRLDHVLKPGIAISILGD